MAQTGWCIDNRNVFFTVLDSGKFEIGAPAWSHSGDSHPPGSQQASFHCVLTEQKGSL